MSYHQLDRKKGFEKSEINVSESTYNKDADPTELDVNMKNSLYNSMAKMEVPVSPGYNALHNDIRQFRTSIMKRKKESKFKKRLGIIYIDKRRFGGTGKDLSDSESEDPDLQGKSPMT